MTQKILIVACTPHPCVQIHQKCPPKNISPKYLSPDLLKKLNAKHHLESEEEE